MGSTGAGLDIPNDGGGRGLKKPSFSEKSNDSEINSEHVSKISFVNIRSEEVSCTYMLFSL